MASNRQLNQVAVGISDDAFVIAVAGTAWFGFYGNASPTKCPCQLTHLFFATERESEVGAAAAKPGFLGERQAGFGHQFQAHLRKGRLGNTS